MSKSEIAQLRNRIEQELEAMRSGLNGLSSGSTRHAFIHARMEHVGVCQDLLATKIGETAASQIVCQLYIQAMDIEGTSERI